MLMLTIQLSSHRIINYNVAYCEFKVKTCKLLNSDILKTTNSLRRKKIIQNKHLNKRHLLMLFLYIFYMCHGKELDNARNFFFLYVIIKCFLMIKDKNEQNKEIKYHIRNYKASGFEIHQMYNVILSKPLSGILYQMDLRSIT